MNVRAGVITVSTTSTTSTGTFQLTISATGGGMTHAATVRLIVTPPCVTATNGGGWVNTPFASQAGTFTAQFDVTPSIATIGGHVGISHGAQTAYTGFANIVRFTTTGTIDARNGASYSAATTLHYTAGATYHVRMAINIPPHQYSIFVTPPGGSEVTIGSNFAFRLLNGHHFSLLSDSSQPAARRSIHQRAARRQWDFFRTDTAGRG